MVSQPEGSESAPKFSRIISVFCSHQKQVRRKAGKKHIFERFGAPQALKNFACGAKTVYLGSFLVFKKPAAGEKKIGENFIEKVDFIESRPRARVRKLPMKREPDNHL